jgi:hypothetical protein
MKTPIVITLIIVGGILITAPIVSDCQQRAQVAEVLPYLVGEIQLEKSGITNVTESAQAQTNLITFLKEITAPLKTPLSRGYRRGCAAVGTLMIMAGIIVGLFMKAGPEGLRKISVEETDKGCQIEVERKNP